MCTKEHWELCNKTPAYYEAKKFALELEEYARLQGYKPKRIKIRTKEQIVKGGFGKADAQVVWTDGPEDWALTLDYASASGVYYQAEDGHTVSFYLS